MGPSCVSKMLELVPMPCRQRNFMALLVLGESHKNIGCYERKCEGVNVLWYTWFSVSSRVLLHGMVCLVVKGRLTRLWTRIGRGSDRDLI